MIWIKKADEPDYWQAYKRRHSDVEYDDLEKSIEGRELKGCVKKEMIHEQKSLCCYCCGAVNENTNTHIEHIKPRSKFPNNSMDYQNLIVSCTNKDSCGMKKNNFYDEGLFVSPLASDCESHFKYDEEGTVYGVTEKGTKTIEVLNLNQKKLKEARKQVISDCINLAMYIGRAEFESVILLEQDGKLHKFYDIISYFDRMGYFDEDYLLALLESGT